MGIGNIEWPHLLADITAKRDALNQVIETLTTHFIKDGSSDAPVVHARRGRKPGRRKTAAKRNERTNERTNERAKRAPTGRRSRSLPDVSPHGEAILAALRAKSPQRPSELAKVLKLERPALTFQIKPLLKSGAVLATGATMNRQFSLPPRSRAAKEAP
jgi:hypothetical protein